MNKPDTWYVQKGVELLGWDQGRYEALIAKVGPDIVHDHIAAQLVRQVDALEPSVVVTIGDRHTEVLEMHGVNRTTVRLYNRTMNTIRAIVDSKVLSNE